MRATEVLKGEHRVIEQVLDCLERMTNRCEREGRMDAEPARDAVAFFRAFIGRCHHEKEEGQLFPLLEERGFSAVTGPTPVMRREHAEGRELIGRLEDAIDGAAAGDAEAARRFVVWGRAYVQLLRAHIRKEDKCLFPMADQLLGVEGQRELFRRFEDADPESAAHDAQLRAADALADRFGVPRAPRDWICWRRSCMPTV